MDLNSGGLMFYKRQKQIVIIDIFCEPCFIMYHIGNGDFKIVKLFDC